jgi:RNA polymerase sigma-70 factor (ECF subfamily)
MWLAEHELLTEPEVSPLRDAQAGDLKAFEVLLEPLLDPAYRLAVLMLRDRTEAEDVVQEAAFRAWKSIRSFRRDRASLKAWFLTIVANQCRQTRRERWWSVVRGPTLVRESVEPEDAALQRSDLAHALAELGREDRVALHLYFGLDLPIDEVARALGVSTRGAKSRIHRTLKRLRLNLEDQEILLP